MTPQNYMGGLLIHNFGKCWFFQTKIFFENLGSKDGQNMLFPVVGSKNGKVARKFSDIISGDKNLFTCEVNCE